MQREMHATENDEELNIRTLVALITSGWRWPVGAAIAGLVAASAAVWLTKPVYEARVIVRPGTVGWTSAPSSAPLPVEPVSQTLERLKLLTFYSDDLVKSCGSPSAQDLAASVKASATKGIELLSINYRTQSPALANTCLGAILLKLTKTQAEAGAPLIRELQEQRFTTKQQIDEIEQTLSVSYRRAAQLPNTVDAPISILLKRDELAKLRKLYRDQSINLSEPFTAPLKPLEPIYVSEGPVSPNRPAILAGGLLAGLVAGIAGLFLRKRWDAIAPRQAR